MNQNNLLRIIIDDREKKLMELFDNKEKKILEYEKKRLDIADVIISSEVVIERKEGFDFVSSIIDNRLFEQLLRLKETYDCPILIIEGLNDNVFENTGMSITSIYGALSFLSYKLGMSVIPTRNLKDTAIVIERIAFREQVKDDVPLLSRKAPRGMSIEDRRAYVLEGLIDCGPKKAKQLIQTFETPYKVFDAIKQTKILYTRTGNPKSISGPIINAGLKGFGWKFIHKNKKLLFDIEKRFIEQQQGLKQKKIL